MGFLKNPLNPFMFMYLFLAGIATAVSPLPALSISRFKVILFGAIIYFSLQFFLLRANERWFTWLWGGMAFAAAGISLVAPFVMLWPPRHVFNLSLITDHIPHLSGRFYIHHNELAGTLLILLPFTFFSWRQIKQKQIVWWAKATVFGGMLLTVVMLILTQSRAGILGIIIAGSAYYFWGKYSWRQIRWGVAGIVASLIFVPFLFLSFSSDLDSILNRFDEATKPGETAASSVIRLEIWQNAGNLIRDYPVIGAGLYTFQPITQANYPYSHGSYRIALTHAHNLWLQTAASLGIAGAVLLAVWWIVVWQNLWDCQSWPQPQQKLAQPLGAAITGYFVFSLADVLTFEQKPGIFLWIILAGAAILIQKNSRQSKPVSRWVYALAPLILLLTMPAFPRNWRNLQLDRARNAGISRPNNNSLWPKSDPRRNGLAAYLNHNEEKALAFWQQDPESAQFLLGQGKMADAALDNKKALNWYRLALQLHPYHSETYYWQGITQERVGDDDAALQSYEMAAQFADSNGISQKRQAVFLYQWGNLLLTEGEPRLAASILQKASTYSPNQYNLKRLGEAWQKVGNEELAAQAFEQAEFYK